MKQIPPTTWRYPTPRRRTFAERYGTAVIAGCVVLLVLAFVVALSTLPERIVAASEVTSCVATGC